MNDNHTTTQELSDDNSSANSDRELVYRQVSTTDSNGNTVVDESGSLSLEQFQRTARPYAHHGPDEDYIYEEGVISESLDDGSVVDTYEVYRRPDNYSEPRESVASTSDDGVEISPLIDTVTEDLTDDDMVVLIAHIRDFPTFYKPLTPPPEMMSLDTAQALSAQRAAVAQDRENTAYSMSQSFRDDISLEGGEVHTVVDWGGAVVFSYPVDAIDDLKNRDDVSYVEPADDPTVTNDSCSEGDQDCYDNLPGVGASDNFLGRARSNERVGVQAYWDAGHTGGEPNPEYHSHGRMAAGVSEAGYFEDRNPCFLSDSPLCDNDRTIAQYDCFVEIDDTPGSGNIFDDCIEQGSWTNSQLAETYPYSASHGTSVTSVLLSNYIDGQGADNELGDPHYEDHGSHTSQWESDATGMAPDAGLVFAKSLDTDSRAHSYSNAYETLHRNGVDVINMSHGYGPICDPTNRGLRADALSAAFDDGVFLVTSAGNVGKVSECTLSSPGTMPRVFTVNSLNFPSEECQEDYRECEIHKDWSSRGGADVEIDGIKHEDVYSLVDVVAPSGFGRATVFDTASVEDPDIPNTGFVDEINLVKGSSHAAPVVSGGALLVKDFLVSTQRMWVNSPGRLHAIMLSMADRWHHYENGHAVSGSDNYSGVGRFKLKPMNTGYDEVMRRWSMRTFSFSDSTGDRVWNPYDTPLPENAELVKCTTNIPQDHRSSKELANVDLALILREPVHGECVKNEGSIVEIQTDFSNDTKKMAAISSNDGESKVAGKCLEYRLINRYIEPGENQMVNNFCYIGTQQDYEPY